MGLTKQSKFPREKLDTFIAPSLIMKFRAVYNFNWSTIVPLDCEQRKRYTHKVSTINPGPQQVKRALSRMLHAVDRNRIFPSAGRGSQVCCDCKPESFPWCHGYAPIDLYDSSGAIIASFLRISYLVQHVKFRFSIRKTYIIKCITKIIVS